MGDSVLPDFRTGPLEFLSRIFCSVRGGMIVELPPVCKIQNVEMGTVGVEHILLRAFCLAHAILTVWNSIHKPLRRRLGRGSYCIRSCCGFLAPKISRSWPFAKNVRNKRHFQHDPGEDNQPSVLGNGSQGKHSVETHEIHHVRSSSTTAFGTRG